MSEKEYKPMNAFAVRNDKKDHMTPFVMTDCDFNNETLQTDFQKYTLEQTKHKQYICQTCFNSLQKHPDTQPVITAKDTQGI